MEYWQREYDISHQLKEIININYVLIDSYRNEVCSDYSCFPICIFYIFFIFSSPPLLLYYAGSISICSLGNSISTGLISNLEIELIVSTHLFDLMYGLFGETSILMGVNCFLLCRKLMSLRLLLRSAIMGGMVGMETNRQEWTVPNGICILSAPYEHFYNFPLPTRAGRL